jgi:hypothetical protein
MITLIFTEVSTDDDNHFVFRAGISDDANEEQMLYEQLRQLIGKGRRLHILTSKELSNIHRACNL